MADATFGGMMPLFNAGKHNNKTNPEEEEVAPMQRMGGMLAGGHSNMIKISPNSTEFKMFQK